MGKFTGYENQMCEQKWIETMNRDSQQSDAERKKGKVLKRIDSVLQYLPVFLQKLYFSLDWNLILL